jgi:hypothetical protein
MLWGSVQLESSRGTLVCMGCERVLVFYLLRTCLNSVVESMFWMSQLGRIGVLNFVKRSSTLRGRLCRMSDVYILFATNVWLLNLHLLGRANIKPLKQHFGPAISFLRQNFENGDGDGLRREVGKAWPAVSYHHLMDPFVILPSI